MTLEQAWKAVQDCARQMNSRFSEVVFDELAIVLIDDKQPRTVSYMGPRRDAFDASFPADSAALRKLVREGDQAYAPGDFAFSHEGTGTAYEAFMVLGERLVLICNNTLTSMETISKNPLWLAAQVPFAELGERFRGNPLTAL